MNWLEIAGTIVGLIYLALEYKANKLLWIAGIIMPAIYVFVYYDAGLYADFGINIYYLLIAVYGYMSWTFGKRTDDGELSELPITRLPRRSLVASLAISLVLLFIFAFVLITFTDSNVPWLDSFTTAVSVVGLWMLARKYVEQWIAWIAVDAVSSGLYIYKELYFTSALYAIYTIIAIFGYYKWKRLMQDNDD
ncbi:MAG: nicotinamide riboside transporter PnuC [Muribaculaceae bacterium]